MKYDYAIRYDSDQRAECVEVFSNNWNNAITTYHNLLREAQLSSNNVRLTLDSEVDPEKPRRLRTFIKE